MAFIPTAENIADLMTKHLKKATHDYLCDKLLFKLHDGAVFRYHGKEAVVNFPEPVREDLTPPDLSRYRQLRPMSLSFCDSEEEMRSIRAMAPAVFPPDHDEVAASHETSRGSPGCPCSVCCDQRKALFKVLTQAVISPGPVKHLRDTTDQGTTTASKRLIKALTKVSKLSSPAARLVSSLRSVSTSAA